MTTPHAAAAKQRDRIGRAVYLLGLIALLAVMRVASAAALEPLLAPGQPVGWWFVFKFNAATFPACGGDNVARACPFGGEVKDYQYGQQFVYASSTQSALQKGTGCVGATVTDPLGATVQQIYQGSFHYVIWNDQFYDDPKITGCTKSCSSPWGHSKGMAAWDDSGEGLVLQVTTPSWPAAGSSAHPRQSDGNTLGCVTDDDVKVSQHFFALKLTKDDLVVVLQALHNASVVTDPSNPQIVSNGGPDDVQKAVLALGRKITSHSVTVNTLSSHVQLIAKPSALHVPPWQLVSSLLGAAPLRTATWWASPRIPTTVAASTVKCWDKSLKNAGAVEIATTGEWDGTVIGLKGGPGADFNHAKIGVSTDDEDYTIFGDMNQQGALSGSNCGSSQNGRGGLFFVIKDHDLSASVASLINGQTAPKTLGKN